MEAIRAAIGSAAARSRSRSSNASRSMARTGSTRGPTEDEPDDAAATSSRRPRSGRCSGSCSPGISTTCGARSASRHRSSSSMPAPAPEPSPGRSRPPRRRAPGRCDTSRSRSRPPNATATRRGSSRAAELPAGPFDGVILANELLDNIPFRLCVFDGAWRESFVADAGGGTFAEVLSAPLDPVPGVLPGAPPHGARAPLVDGAVAWLGDARSRLSSGRIAVIDYVRADDGVDGVPAVAGMAPDLSGPRARPALPRRAGGAGHHDRGPARPAPRTGLAAHPVAIPAALGHRRPGGRGGAALGCARGGAGPRGDQDAESCRRGAARCSTLRVSVDSVSPNGPRRVEGDRVAASNAIAFHVERGRRERRANRSGNSFGYRRRVVKRGVVITLVAAALGAAGAATALAGPTPAGLPAGATTVAPPTEREAVDHGRRAPSPARRRPRGCRNASEPDSEAVDPVRTLVPRIAAIPAVLAVVDDRRCRDRPGPRQPEHRVSQWRTAPARCARSCR